MSFLAAVTGVTWNKKGPLCPGCYQQWMSEKKFQTLQGLDDSLKKQ
jgi:hypothetical protein